MNPIQTAVAPLKSDAIKRANDEVDALVARITRQLAEVDNDLDRAAPFPNSLRDSRIVYKRKHALRSLIQRIARSRDANRRPGQPNIVYIQPELVATFTRNAEVDAAAQYDLFVAKLVAKIGDVTEATLTGNHVWSYSTLRVVKPDGSVEVWRTQQIVNVSKLGKLFNQWPTRRVGGV